MSCMSMGLKILTFVNCELADVSELDLDLVKRDPDFIVVAKKFLQNQTRVKDILHLPQGIFMDNQDVVALGIPVFGAVGYLI